MYPGPGTIQEFSPTGRWAGVRLVGLGMIIDLADSGEPHTGLPFGRGNARKICWVYLCIY